MATKKPSPSKTEESKAQVQDVAPKGAPEVNPAVIETPAVIQAQVPAEQLKAASAAGIDSEAYAKYMAMLNQRDRLEMELKKLRDESRAAAVQKVQEILRSVGLRATIEALPGAAPYRNPHPLLGRPVVKYRHAITGETWSGRGREPEWMHDTKNVIRA